MKQQSYKIKHDFLFDSDDNFVDIQKFDSVTSEVNELKISDVLKTKDKDSFMNLVDTNKPNIVIKDDIGNCINPASERYKQFIIRCIYRKLKSHGMTIYL